MIHIGIRQLTIIWNLIQENSEDNYEFSSAEKRALNTHTHTSNYSFTVQKSKRFRLIPYGFIFTVVELAFNPLVA